MNNFDLEKTLSTWANMRQVFMLWLSFHGMVLGITQNCPLGYSAVAKR